MAHFFTVSQRLSISVMLMASVQGFTPAPVSHAINTPEHIAVYQGESFITEQMNVAPAPPARNVASSAITGTITISETGAGVPFMRVDYWGCYLLTNSQSLRHTVTDADGNFSFGDVGPGLNRLNFYPDYTPNPSYLHEYYAIGGNNIQLIVPDNATLGLNLHLALGGQVTGHVQNIAGNPLQDVYANVLNESGITGYGKTDSSGNFVVTGIPSGKYQVRFVPSYNGVSASYAYSLAGTIAVTAPGTTSNVKGVLVKGGSITGTITAADTGGPTGFYTTMTHVENLDDKTFADSWPTDINDGSYNVTNLMPGHYRLYASIAYESNPYMQMYFTNTPTATLATTVTVSAGKTISNINIALAKGGQIMGKVTYGDVIWGYPAQSITVQVLNTYDQVVATGTTSPQGIYVTSPGLPTGNYKVRFQGEPMDFCDQFKFPMQYYPGTTSLSAAIPVSVTAGSITPNINADLSLVLPRVYTPIIQR